MCRVPLPASTSAGLLLWYFFFACFETETPWLSSFLTWETLTVESCPSFLWPMLRQSTHSSFTFMLSDNSGLFWSCFTTWPLATRRVDSDDSIFFIFSNESRGLPWKLCTWSKFLLMFWLSAEPTYTRNESTFEPFLSVLMITSSSLSGLNWFYWHLLIVEN